MKPSRTRAIFLDRDGVVNRRIVGDYVRDWSTFEFLSDIFSVLPEIRESGYTAVLVTNQRGVARGLMTEEDLAAIHERMQNELASATGHRFDAIYYCPHDSSTGCDCRKPLPGMIVRAALEHDIDIPASWMIGDSESDIEAGAAAGCRTARVMEGDDATTADLHATSLRDAWNLVRDLSSSD